MCVSRCTAALPESQVATQLLKSIRDKDSLVAMETILDSLATANPELIGEGDSLSLSNTHNMHSQHVF